MKYILKIQALGKYPELDISSEEFHKIKLSRETLNYALSIAEKFEILLSNYLDLEKEILSISADSLVSSPSNHIEFFQNRISTNRRIVNLLTSTKLYVDQVPSHVKSIFSGVEDKFKEAQSYFNEEYDASFEYRLMEALRNHVQHNGLAVHSTSYPFKWTDEEESRIELKTQIFVSKIELSKNKKFKKSTLNEMPEKYDLLLAARGYVGSLSIIHSKIVGLIEEVSNQSRNTIDLSIEKYVKESDGLKVGLSAFKLKEAEPISDIIERVAVLTDWDDVRLMLNKKHKQIGNLKMKFVTNRL
ncbi:hypothetical protein ACG1BZ_17515 [Microbulbifer sp. CNSA002]|uniref:hypothetical protein n=1 Tax=Microbulbifer sp. CNSA002 TaxID=3373604 RepID=UPI0039B4120D